MNPMSSDLGSTSDVNIPMQMDRAYIPSSPVDSPYGSPVDSPFGSPVQHGAQIPTTGHAPRFRPRVFQHAPTIIRFRQQPVLQRAPTIIRFQPPPPQPPSMGPPPSADDIAAPAGRVPCGDLLASREDYSNICAPLYEASINGDWKAANDILVRKPELVQYAISENYETALHVAASAKSTKAVEGFVENLVAQMETPYLQLQKSNYNTALCTAAMAGNVTIAGILVRKDRCLLDIPGNQGMMPIEMAVLFGKRDMVDYLYGESKMMGNLWTDEKRAKVLKRCVEAELYDVAQRIVDDFPELATSGSVLQVLAVKPEAFVRTEQNKISRITSCISAILHLEVRPVEEHSPALRLLRTIWSEVMRLDSQKINDIIKAPIDASLAESKGGILFAAAASGNTTFVIELIRTYPELMWMLNDDGCSIFHIAVINRHEGIYNLLYEIGSEKELITALEDQHGNNMLHLVGMTPMERRVHASGVSLLMQRELLWFKEVKKMIPPSYATKLNKESLSPYALFSKNNKDVVSQGLNWIKDCMVVATLIITVAFAVVFTVPGGYDQNNGIPMFIHEGTFLVFIIADAISLFSSSASLLVFLSIVTSRYGQHDFLNSLPRKLMIGLGTLFISITAMMVTFSVSFFVLYHNRLKWVPILVTAFAAVPVLLFASLEYPLLADMFRSTYDSRYLFNPRRRMLYNRT